MNQEAPNLLDHNQAFVEKKIKSLSGRQNIWREKMLSSIYPGINLENPPIDAFMPWNYVGTINDQDAKFQWSLFEMDKQKPQLEIQYFNAKNKSGISGIHRASIIYQLLAFDTHSHWSNQSRKIQIEVKHSSHNPISLTHQREAEHKNNLRPAIFGVGEQQTPTQLDLLGQETSHVLIQGPHSSAIAKSIVASLALQHTSEELALTVIQNQAQLRNTASHEDFSPIASFPQHDPSTSFFNGTAYTQLRSITNLNSRMINKFGQGSIKKTISNHHNSQLRTFNRT